MNLKEDIRQKAFELGFSIGAFINTAGIDHEKSFDQWLIEGRHGDMTWIEKHRDLRFSPSHLEERSQTVLVLLTNYLVGDDTLGNGLRIARYAHGEDYHHILKKRLAELSDFIHEITGASVYTRSAVDSAPIHERELARRAGLGWIGKNAMLIHQGIGSFTFICELFIDMALEPDEVSPTPDRCGTCSRCLDACPTGAIISPYVVDARRCIAYLTIELRGPIPRHLRPYVNNHLFGCDICQDVCPWNTSAQISTDPDWQVRPILHEMSIEDVLTMTSGDYRRMTRGSSILRAHRRGLQRNAAVVLGNRRNDEDLTLLSEQLFIHSEPLVRGHLAWAVGQWTNEEALETLRKARLSENDPYVVEEIQEAIALLESNL